MQPIDRPLIRLRVHYLTDTLGKMTNGAAPEAPLNAALFGKQFLEKVANAKDLVTLHRKSQQETKEKNALLRSWLL